MVRSLFAGLIALVFVASSAFASETKSSVEVKGNCKMCKKRIEKTVSGIDGVSTASWDKTSKKLDVTFDASKTNLAKIEAKIAEVGHDTKSVKAESENYGKLPRCCKYRENPNTH